MLLHSFSDKIQNIMNRLNFKMAASSFDHESEPAFSPNRRNAAPFFSSNLVQTDWTLSSVNPNWGGNELKHLSPKQTR